MRMSALNAWHHIYHCRLCTTRLNTAPWTCHEGSSSFRGTSVNWLGSVCIQSMDSVSSYSKNLHLTRCPPCSTSSLRSLLLDLPRPPPRLPQLRKGVPPVQWGLAGLSSAQRVGVRPLHPLIVCCCADRQRFLLAGSCAGLGLTATLYAAGSCTPVAHSTTIGNSAVCDDTFNNDGGICTYCNVISVCLLTRPSSPLLSVRAPAGLHLYGQLRRRAVHQLRDVQLPELHLL
jgi:hypothetical protein